MIIEELKGGTEWEAFLERAPGSSFYHTLKWKDILEKSFSLRTVYLTIRNDDERLIGIFPAALTYIGNMSVLNSLPYSDHGGPVIEAEYLSEASIRLSNFLQEYSKKNHISISKICFLKNPMTELFKSPQCYVNDNEGVVRLDIRTYPACYLWQKVLIRTVRKKIKRLERDGFQVREATSRSDLNEFYQLYQQNMHRIGAKAFPFSFFETLWCSLRPENFSIFLFGKDRSLGGEAFFKYDKTIYFTYVGLDKDSFSAGQSLAPFKYWSLINWAESKGMRFLDFGSTPTRPERTSWQAMYSQKMMFGGSFLQQETIYVPYSSLPSFTLLAGSFVIGAWKRARKVFPRRYANILQNAIGKL